MTIWGKHVIMKETLIVIISGREGSAPMVEKTIRRHPVRQRRIYTRGEESRKMSFKVIDSSLRFTILFPVFPTKHYYLRSE